MRRRNQQVNFSKDPCLTMHQPWASLLVYGIKRIEGRSWPSPIKGRLWIHAASKVPDAGTIKAMEDFYNEIYALDGVTDLQFPDQYPVSRLVGCVEVVGCLRREELASWKAVPEGVRLEGLTNFCWLCERPQILSDPLRMRGDQGVYNLERKIIEDAVNGLLPVESPWSMKFPLPYTADHNSSRPGSLCLDKSEDKILGAEKPPSLVAAIDGARAAATQFSKKDTKPVKIAYQDNNMMNNELVNKLKNVSVEEDRIKTGVDIESKSNTEGNSEVVAVKKEKQLGSRTERRLLDQHSVGSSMLVLDMRVLGSPWYGRSLPSLSLFSAAVRGIRPV